MRPLVLALVLAACAIPALSATVTGFVYTARTAAPAARTGAVTAAGITWSCSGSACTTAGPWPQPGVIACRALAQQVGRITAYGREGAQLDAAGLAQCNAGAASAASTLPRVAAPIPPPAARALPPTATLRTPPAAAVSKPPPAAQMVLEQYDRKDQVLHVLTPSLSWTGTGTGPYTPLGTDTEVAFAGSALRLPALRHTGSPHPGEVEVPTGSGVADVTPTTSPSGLWIEAPIEFREFAQRARRAVIKCSLSAIRTGSFAATFSDANAIGEAELSREIRDNLSTVARLPVRLDPFYSVEHAHAVQCSATLDVLRLPTAPIPGVDHIPLVWAIDPARREFLPGMARAAGTESRTALRFNVEH